MKLKFRFFLLWTLAVFSVNLSDAQIVSITPRFPKITDSLTIIYDATKGNAALKDCTQIYIHTGLVTSSATGTGWTNTATSWGVDQPKARLTNLGNNQHQIKYIPTHYYNVNASFVAYRFSFVFRNRTGTITGKTEQNQDIFMPIYQSGQQAVAILNPTSDIVLCNLNDNIPFSGASSAMGNLKLFSNGSLLTEVLNDTNLITTLPTNTGGSKKILFQFGDNALVSDSLTLRVNPAVIVEALPAGIEDGINILGPTSAILVLRAPFKNNVYVRGEFNNWELRDEHYMKRTPDGKRWWIQIDGLDPTKAYSYQYFVDGTLSVADPYSRIILDPNNDGSIPVANYPARKPYPTGKTTGNVSVLRTVENPYTWTNTTFQRPQHKDLIIYELLIRDFLNAKNYKTLADTLNYLKKLGINCIQLMPIMEFEGNNSWGYNPSHHFALDKYYGRDDFFKAFVDKAHNMGIAVVLDIALNHSFGQSPLAQLYWNGAQNRPAANNPWLNETAKHPYNVGYDMNHKSADTRYYVNRVVKNWLEEFKVDGFRFDLSKGFTQKNTCTTPNCDSGNEVSNWGARDTMRINIWKNLYNTIQSHTPGSYVILEHFADNSEETELANYGMMIWGNLNNNYMEGSMGYPSTSDLSWGYYKNRGWSNPNLVTYMESHDEERMMYKNITYGNATQAAQGYSVKDTLTGLNRVKLASSFFYTIPGAKMIWQFGELGYNYSINRCGNGTINTNCRTDEKPIKWSFLSETRRLSLYRHHQALMALKRLEPVFSSTQATLAIGGIAMKRIVLVHNTRNAVVLGNFGVTVGNIVPNFTGSGIWYEFFTGDSITVNNTTDPISLQAGEYRLYSNKRWLSPDDYILIIDDKKPVVSDFKLSVFPNPASDNCMFQLPLLLEGSAEIHLYDASGKEVLVKNVELTGGFCSLDWKDNKLPSGLYHCRLLAGKNKYTSKLVVN